jgi:REP-associated tyrosine transposase
MARIARVVVPGCPHHLTQRGNRRQETFFEDDDYRTYMELMAESCGRCGVEVWAYCLMPNHVHLIVVPSDEEGLAGAIGEAHRRYSRHVNFREGWRGHLWQGRFASFVMDDDYLLAAARYIELNPVRARIVRKPHRYRYSSARAHLEGRADPLLSDSPLRSMVDDWSSFLSEGTDEQEQALLRRHESTGRPLGSKRFIRKLEKILGRVLRPQKGGRPRKSRKN